jgi:hypothetical protein
MARRNPPYDASIGSTEKFRGGSSRSQISHIVE